jgi:hypothetical protein
MALTTGFVQRVTLLESGPTACLWIGPSATSTELLFIVVRSTDTDADIAFKGTMLALLVDAQVTGRQVDVGHDESSSEVTTVATTACDVVANPVQLDAVEVTQAIQHLSLAVPLVAGKGTVVRLYLSHYGSPGITVRGQIALRQQPADPPVVVDSVNTAFLDPAQAGDIPAKRNDASRSLNFPLPDVQTAEGPLSITIASITDVATNAPVALGCEARPIVWFHFTPPLRVRVLGMRYVQGTPPVTYLPTDLDFDLLLSWLGRAYPVGHVDSSLALVTATAAPPFGCGDINAQLAAIRALDVASGQDSLTHYYGLVSDGGFFMRGCAAGIPSTPAPETVASGPTGPATWGWDFDGTYGDWYGGHELGHTYGRLHPGFCGETQDDLNNYPYDNGQLGSSDDSFAGFDVGDSARGLPMVALQGTQWHDVMTYCNFQWLSAYTYQGIRQRLLAENA